MLTKKKPKLPSWGFAILVAAMAPLTGAAVSCGQILVQRERGKADLALARAKQKHDFRMAYFEKAIIGEPEQKTAVLRCFLSASFDDAELRHWALEELGRELIYKRCSENCRTNVKIPDGLILSAADEYERKDI